MTPSETYKPTDPTPSQIASNAIRAMFFHKHYNGVVPVKDLEVVKNGKQWHGAYGKKAVQDSIKSLTKAQHINLDEAGENWLWGLPGMHEELFPKS